MGTQGDRTDTLALENGGSSQRETAELGEFCQRGGWARLGYGKAARLRIRRRGRKRPVSTGRTATGSMWPTQSRRQLDLGRAVVRVLGDLGECAGLAALVADWDGRTAPLWRKRFARHIRDCAGCSARSSPRRIRPGARSVPCPVRAHGDSQGPPAGHEGQRHRPVHRVGYADRRRHGLPGPALHRPLTGGSAAHAMPWAGTAPGPASRLNKAFRRPCLPLCPL